jgi:hypothetical protein
VFLIDLARMLSLGAALAQNVLAEYADAKKQMKIKLALDGFPLDEAKYREYQTNLWHKADSAIIMYLKHTKLNTAHWGRKQMMLDADFRKTKGEILRQLKSVALVEFRRGDSSANLISDDKGHRCGFFAIYLFMGNFGIK